MKISVVIPAYNEKTTVSFIVKQALAAFLPKGISREIIVVDDGSSDGTGEVLQRFRDRPEVRVFSLKKNSGKAAALVRGIQESSGDIIIIQDADFEYSPENYCRLIEPILSGKAPVVYGSRFLGTIANMTRTNRTANIISNVTFNLLYGTQLTDINTCHKAFRAPVIKNIEITSSNFAFETEVTAKIVQQGINIVEIPIAYQARTRSEGKKINWGKALEMFWGIVRYKTNSSRKN